MRTSNLFSPNIFAKRDLPDVNLYFTDAEEERYTHYFYETDNRAFNPFDSSEQITLTYVFTQLKELKPGANEAFFNKLEENHILKHDPELQKFTETDAYVVYSVFRIVALTLIAISLLILILSVFFISFSLSKEIEMYKEQIFILKAMGYRSSSLAFIWWVRTLMILLIGFWIGWLLSFEVQILTNKMMSIDANFIIHPVWFNAIYISLILFIVPLFLSLINYVYLWKLISKKSLVNMNESPRSILKASIFKKKHYFKNKISYIFNHIRYFDKLATIEKSTKSFFILFISIFFELMFIFELGTKRFINETVDQVSPTYNKLIDSSFKLDEAINWRVNGSRILTNSFDSFELKTIKYQTDDQFEKILNNQQTHDLDLLVKNYLSINRDEPKNLVRTQIAMDFLILNTLDLNHTSLRIQTIQNLLQVIEKDYQIFFKSKTLKPIHHEIQELLKSIQTGMANIANQKIYYTINNVFLQKDVDYKVLNLDLFPKNYQWMSGKRWKLFMLDNKNSIVFDQDLKPLEAQKIENRVIPVITTKHFALLNHLKVGDIIQDIPLDKDNSSQSISLQIFAINKDTVSNNFYALRSSWNQVTNVPEFYNEIYTKRSVINSNLKITTNYLNGLYIPRSNGKLYLADLIRQKPVNFLSPKTFGTANFQSLTMVRKQTEKKASKFRDLLDTIIIISVFLILILFVVYIMVNTNNNLDDIYTLRAIGYQSFEVNSYVNANYFLILIVSIIITGLIAYFVWQAAIYELLNSEAKMVVNNPFSFIDVLITFTIVGGIFTIGYSESYLATKNIFIHQNHS